MADLQELFSRLRSSSGTNGVSSSSSNTGPQHPSNYRQPSVSSPIFSPPSHTPNPTGSAILSPNASTPVQDAKAANLLNLLRFNGRTPSQSSPLTALQNVGNVPTGLSPGELGNASGMPQFPKDRADMRKTMPSSNAQEILLNLLNQPSKSSNAGPASQAPRPKPGNPSQVDVANNLAEASLALDAELRAIQSRETTPVRVFGSVASRETTPFNPPRQTKTNGMFTYVNPFEHLSASTPRSKSPKAEGTAEAPPTQSTPSKTSRSDDSQTQLASKKIRREQDGPKSPVIKKEVIESIPDSWQNDDAAGQANAVQVFNFPMRPFVSIRLENASRASNIGGDGIMDIVRLKKEFDQIDRVLVTASQSHIVYAMSKSGGIRIIRQDSGRDKQVFKSSQERMFHIQINEAIDGTVSDSILAAGINGSVFWTKIEVSEEEKFNDENLESKGFILPPIITQDENTSGSPVKTRSKMSSRHQDIFAISRGKSIHIVTPSVAILPKYTDSKSRIVDAAKYFQDKNLKISTGKACKDFTFSEDDTTIASLDKAGRIKFWDIKELSEAARGPKRASIELKTSLMSFAASMGSEKVSPTSIMFVDKERPCLKGVALRYLLVGFKQNHSLQLWDLGLGKPVQELHFPHEKDSDAICSISYHPKTGIIALAHPTRNSIYFVHLSAPRYHIPNMDQAKYLSLLAADDSTLPKPESTAIMSGIRELSFANKGQIRSVDMLKNPASASSDVNETGDVLFELYAMHSTGVTCLSIKKADLGWGSDNKVIRPIDAEKSGFVTIVPIVAGTETNSSSEVPSKPDSANTKGIDSDKVAETTSSKISAPMEKATSSTNSLFVESDKPESRPTFISKAIDNAASSSYAAAAARVGSTSIPEPVAHPTGKEALSAKSISLADRTKAETTTRSRETTASDTVTALSSILTTELAGLYRQIEGDRRVQDAAANARQDAVLKLVSSTLTDNVEKSLGKIVSSSIQNEVLPAVSDVFASMAESRLVGVLRESIKQSVSQEINAGLNNAVKTALRDQECLQTIREPLSGEISQRILGSMEGVVRKSIAPTISQTIATAVQKAIADNEAKVASQRAEQDGKMDRLATLIYGLSESVQRMAASQATLQEQLSTLQKQLANGNGRQPAGQGSSSPSPADVAKSVEDEELEEITALMTEGRFEDGTIKWLQSSRQGELFDRLFVRVNPQYLQKLSPLVKLSVSAAVSTSFEQNVDQRLDWLGIILASTDLKDPEIAAVAPKIMHVLLSRIQGAYMAFAESNPSDPVLRNFSNLSRQITDIGRALG